MSSPGFRQFVHECVSSEATFECGVGFSLKCPYDEHLLRSRKIIALLEGTLGQRYHSEYDFNLKKSRYLPADFA